MTMSNEEQARTDWLHRYRSAIADDCIVGLCSINNCLYPDCSPIERQRAEQREFRRKVGGSVFLFGGIVFFGFALWSAFS